MKAKLLSGLGIKGYLVTDGKNPINLFNTANGLMGANWSLLSKWVNIFNSQLIFNSLFIFILPLILFSFNQYSII